MEKTLGTRIGGAGLGVDIKLTLRIGEIRTGLDTLTHALQETGETATRMVGDAVRKMREAGAANLKKVLGEKGEGGEVQDLYERIVTSLRSAAERGEQEARGLLEDMGEKVEAGGRGIRHSAQKESETIH